MASTNGMNGVSEYAQFYNSDNHDRVYDADSMAEWLTPFFVDGVFNGQMQVLATEGMRISVEPGFGYIDGKVKHFVAKTFLDVDIAHAQYPRIDIVVLRRDDTERDFFIALKKGTAAQNPVAPELTRNNTIWELQLAKIDIPVGITEITQANITDTRMNKPECGWVAATVEEIDFNQIKVQYDAWYNQFTSGAEGTYETWRTAFEDNADNWYDRQVDAFTVWFNNIREQLYDEKKLEDLILEQINKKTTFNDDGTILEEFDGGLSRLTTFNDDGTIVVDARLGSNTFKRKTITFNDDESITESVVILP